MKNKIRISAIVVLLLLLFARLSGKFLVINQPGRSDSILVLAGETDVRYMRALELYRQSYGAKIILDVKCPASGESGRNHWPNLERLRADRDEVKFVVADRADWEFAREIIERYDLQRRALAVLVSPVWGRTDLRELADLVASGGLDVRMQLQLHKYIWGPEARGV